MKRIILSDIDGATNTSGIPAMPDMYDTIKPSGDIISGSSDLLDDTLSDFIYKRLHVSRTKRPCRKIGS